ncbi:MAG: cell division protein ZapA [Alphaproteobacteria bacterium]
MAQINLTINGRNYGIACDDGQEKRVRDLGYYVDQRMKEIARAGAATNDAHLLVLTALVLADEIYELREENTELGHELRSKPAANPDDEEAMARAIGHLAERIDLVAGRIAKA